MDEPNKLINFFNDNNNNIKSLFKMLKNKNNLQHKYNE